MTELRLEPLTFQNFGPFGTVISFEPGKSRLVNEGAAQRADTPALFDYAAGAAPVLAFYRARTQNEPLHLTLFERHPSSSQTFISLSVPRFLVIVAPTGPDGLPVVPEARAFVGQRGSGISYRRNQWHVPVLALGEGGDLLMLMAERGSADDCIEHRISWPLTVSSTGPAP